MRCSVNVRRMALAAAERTRGLRHLLALSRGPSGASCVAVARLLMLSLAVWLSPGAWAQPTGSPLPPGTDLSKPLTLADCIQLALAINPAVSIAGQSTRDARAAADQVRAAQLPNLLLYADTSASRGLRRSSSFGGSATGAIQTERNADVVLSQTFYQSGLREQIKAARANVQASQFGERDAQRRVVVDVAQSYYTVLADRALVEVAGRALATSEQHLEAAQYRIASGLSPAADRYPFEAELAQARLQVISSESDARVALANLKQAIGLSASTSMEVADGLARLAVPGVFDDLLQAAYRNRPEVHQLEAQIEAARMTLRAAEILHGPALGANASLTYGSFTGLQGHEWTGLLALSLPLFDGGLTKARVDSARAGLASIQETLLQTQISVGSEVERDYLQAVAADARIDAAEAAVRAAQVSLEAAEGKYAAGGGVGTVIDVTDAALKLRQAETDRVQALYDLNSALAALRAATGNTELIAGGP